jgi:glycine dehydrogenase subunit 1
VSRGIDWIVAGWRGFAASPGMWIVLAIIWILITLALQMLPLVGMLAGFFAAPILAGGLHPHYRAVAETLSRMSGAQTDAHAADPEGGLEDLAAAIDSETSCVVVQTPDFFGRLHDLTAIAEAAHEQGALLIAVATEAVSLGAVRPPGAMGADIVVAEGQSIGNGLNFGGPYVGLFATRRQFLGQMPGRVCGETVDGEGRRGFVLTLSTRGQHIRRDKATSNICTNSGLCALAFTIHLALLGEAGLKRLAALNHASAVALADALAQVKGVEVLTPAFFNEFTIRVPGDAAKAADALSEKGVLAGVPVSRLLPGQHEDLIVVAATEMTTDEDRAAYVKALEEVLA